MSRVLVTGGAAALGAAIVRRLLADPDYEVRVCDPVPAPSWMREGSEVRREDPRDLATAREVMQGCDVVVHVAAAPMAGARELLAGTAARSAAVVEAAVHAGVDRLCLVSSAAVYERADRFPTPEEDAAERPLPRAPQAVAELAAERLCLAAHEQDGLAVTICRPSDPYGPDDPPGASLVSDLLRTALRGDPQAPAGGETRTPTYARDVADGVVAALAAPAAVGEEINLAGREELTTAELQRRCRAAAGRPQEAGGRVPRAARRHPEAEKAARILGWRATTDLREGIELTAARLRAQEGVIAA